MREAPYEAKTSRVFRRLTRLAPTLVALLPSCERPAAPTATPILSAPQPPASAPSGERKRSPFFVVAEGMNGDTDGPSTLRLCPLRGAVALCSPALVFSGNRFVNVGLGSGGIMAERVPKLSGMRTRIGACPEWPRQSRGFGKCRITSTSTTRSTRPRPLRNPRVTHKLQQLGAASAFRRTLLHYG